MRRTSGDDFPSAAAISRTVFAPPFNAESWEIKKNNMVRSVAVSRSGG